MRYAIVADIHGNLEALETVADYLIQKRLVTRIALPW